MANIVAYHEPSGGTIKVDYDHRDKASYKAAVQDLAKAIVHYYSSVALMMWDSLTLWDGDPTEGDEQCTPINVRMVLDIVKAVEDLYTPIDGGTY